MEQNLLWALEVQPYCTQEKVRAYKPCQLSRPGAEQPALEEHKREHSFKQSTLLP